jgi:hypothetical protein
LVAIDQNLRINRIQLGLKVVIKITRPVMVASKTLGAITIKIG